MPWPPEAAIWVGEAFTEKGICSLWKQENNIELAETNGVGVKDFRMEWKLLPGQ